MKKYDFYIDLIENPFSIKKYKQLANHYMMLGMQNEADAFLHAISVKFNESDNTHIDKES